MPTGVGILPCSEEKDTPLPGAFQHLGGRSSPTVPSESRWFNATRAAAIYGIEPHTILDAIQRGEVPARRIGRQWFIPAWFVEGADLVSSVG